MPQANITYDAPYNRSMVSFIEELDRKHWEKAYPAYHPNPMGFRLGTFHGEPVSEVKVGGGSSPEKYLRSGNSPAYPPFNMNAGMAVNSGGARYSGVDGAVGGKGFNPFDFGYNLGHDVIGPALMGRGRKPRAPRGGKFNFGKALGSIGKIAEPIATKVAEKALMKSVGLGRGKGGKFNFGKALGSIGKIAEPIATKVAEKALMKSVGLGRQPKVGGKKFNFLNAVKSVGHAVGEPVGRVSQALLEKEALGALGLGRKTASRGRSARAEIVKQVMREKGMKMIEASKYVKAHGLY